MLSDFEQSFADLFAILTSNNLSSFCLQSAVSLIGAPGEIYSFGTSYLLIYIGICLSYVVSAWSVVPLVYPLEVTSIYQYLDMRFHSKTLTGLITGIAVARLICYMSIALLAPALALQVRPNHAKENRLTGFSPCAIENFPKSLDWKYIKISSIGLHCGELSGYDF